ncbi:hypothetical protein Tco_1526308 [Tanacetum coccineum]
MASDSSSQNQPKQLTPSLNVPFKVKDCIIKFNNGVALIESNNDAYKPLLQFWKNSYTASKSITFTRSHFDKPLTFHLNTFSSVIGIDHSDECVLVPQKETVKVGLATLGLVATLSPAPIQSLILPSREVNANKTADKSLSGTLVPSVTQPKAPTAKRTRKKKISSST